ncbi:hypothetical protein OHA40_10375 [Nocardia sp. NBC_00508]|uniref:hypothetical protein n=1 Tax=Nocardia sp. NBC_00508 TaxID=2975992 RepID=UPI002E80BE57|nr:hypothetical protein [Nocardia sp. NBC_00508]WUD68471.1 hypothetical protein OHA40_10375 [Nocardia sp. NBC_00508]
MTSEGDARENESDQSGSEFGPPLGEFGPPVSEFGLAVSEFGPPMGADTGPRWQVPQQPTDHPELIWRPAGEPETTPAPPPQFRAPDSTVYTEQPPAPAQAEQPAAEPARPQNTGSERDTWWNQPTAEGGVPKPPPASESGLSWAEDPIAMRLALRVPPTPAPARRSGSSPRWVVLGALAAVVVLIALTVTIIAVSRDNGDSSAAPSVGGTTAALSCPSNKDGKVTVGNGSGDAGSGPGAILGFQYAFYVERSGERARRFVAADAENVSTAEVIQQGIDEQVPVGTTHCLRITELATDTFDVDLTEHRPDGTTTVYKQTITTASRDGKTLVYAIRERL